jgi:hypothetical protein
MARRARCGNLRVANTHLNTQYAAGHVRVGVRHRLAHWRGISESG